MCQRDLPQEDLGKIHAEVNQLLNQRYLLTSAAIGLFGAFSAFLAPGIKGAFAEDAEPWWLSALGAVLLLLFLLILFLWNSFLGNLHTVPTTYLRRRGSSQWEKHIEEFRTQAKGQDDAETAEATNGLRRRLQRLFLSEDRIQATVFLFIGILSVAWPLVSLMLRETGGRAFWGASAAILVLAFYVWIVIAVGWRQWLRDVTWIESIWERVLDAEAGAVARAAILGDDGDASQRCRG